MKLFSVLLTILLCCSLAFATAETQNAVQDNIVNAVAKEVDWQKIKVDMVSELQSWLKKPVRIL
jgi:hypothetical protein